MRGTGKTRAKKIKDSGLGHGKAGEGLGEANKGREMGITFAMADGREGGRTHLGRKSNLALAEPGVVDEGIDALGVGGGGGIKGERAGVVEVGHAGSITVRNVTVKR